MVPARGVGVGLLGTDKVSPPRAAEDIVSERQLVPEVVLFHHPRRPQAADVQVVLDSVLLGHHLLQHLGQGVAARVGAVRLGLGHRHRVRVEEMPHPGVPADQDELPEHRARPAGLQQPEQALDRDIDDGLGCLLAGGQVQDVRHPVHRRLDGRALVDRSGHDLQPRTRLQDAVMAQRPDREPGQALIAGCEQPADERLPDLARRAGNQNPLHVCHDQIMNRWPCPIRRASAHGHAKRLLPVGAAGMRAGPLMSWPPIHTAARQCDARFMSAARE